MALLDRIAGAARGAARFGSGLRRLRGLEAEATALDALGGAAQRGALQAMVDQARARVAPRAPRPAPACSGSAAGYGEG